DGYPNVVKATPCKTAPEVSHALQICVGHAFSRYGSLGGELFLHAGPGKKQEKRRWRFSWRGRVPRRFRPQQNWRPERAVRCSRQGASLLLGQRIAPATRVGAR